VHADTDRDRAAARSAADAGADAFDQGQYERALELFGRAEQLVHAPTHLLFIARSLAKLGRLVESHEAYLKIVNEQLPATAPGAFKSAHARAEDEIGGIEARIAHVTVTVRGPDASRAALSIDHVEVPAAEQGIPIPMDPGVHAFSAHTEQARSDEKSVTLRDGTKESLELTLAAPLPSTTLPVEQPVSSSQVAASASKSDSSSAQGGSSGRRVVAYTSLGIGIAATGVGTYFLISSVSNRTKASNRYNGTACVQSLDTCDYQYFDHKGDVARNWAIGMYAAAAAGLGTGIVLLLTDHRPSQKQSMLPFHDLRVNVGIGSLSASGRF
jgi:hypothetical protein